MRLTHLILTNFRNYLSLDWKPPPGLVFLLGANAQGKSNLLEAIATLALARSPRAGSDRETVAWPALAESQPVNRIAARIERARGPVEVEIAIRAAPDQAGDERLPPSHKRIRVNGVPCRASELVGQVNAALFSPDDGQLVTGPPALRRRYLDMTISQVDSRYLRELQRYQHVLQQRNHLLRRINEGAAQHTELEYWDGELARSGAAITLARRRALALLVPQAADAHLRLASGAERLCLDYQTSWEPGAASESDEGAVAAALTKALALGLSRDLSAGVSLLGPHRDDLIFTLEGRSLASYGSRGQQRTAALALKLAEAHFLERSTKERPLLLLDDALSELDARRRANVLELAVSLEQALVTASEPAAIPRSFLERASMIQVRSGTLQPA